MSDWVESESHQEVSEHFDDVAVQQDADVPESVSSHVRQCPFCRGRTVRLKEAVLGTQSQGDDRRTPMKRSVIDTLDSHFRCLDEQVTCSRARPFLPGMLEPSLRVRIPTPITVHVDQCPHCAGDLQVLRDLALGSEQLQRLHRLYEHKPAGGLLSCRRARTRISAFVRGAREGIDGAILNHLSTCPRCRAEVYAHRQAILQKLAGASDDCPCDATAAGLFDHVVPCEGTFHGDEPPGVSHVATCRKCLETIQAVHRAVYGIAERPESGVATVYRTVEEGRTLPSRPGSRYAEYPIAVEVVHRGPRPRTARRRTVLKHATFSSRVRRVLATAVAAAAMISLAALFHYTRSASGVTLGKVSGAFGQARNVRVVGFNPYTDQVTYELWISRDLNLEYIVTAQGGIVYDLGRKEKRAVDSGTVAPVGDIELANVKQMADGILGFTLAGVPGDARWDRVDGGGGREVYELTWMKQTQGGRGIGVKYEVLVDKSTLLPEMLRVFHRESMETGWESQSVTVLEYLTEAEMTSMLADEPFAEAEGGR